MQCVSESRIVTSAERPGNPKRPHDGHGRGRRLGRRARIPPQCHRPAARPAGPIGSTHGIPRRQEAAHHRAAVEPLDRLRHRPGLPPRGRRAGLQLRRRTLQRPHRRIRRRIRQRAGVRLRRRQTTPRSRPCSTSSARPGRSSTASCIRSASRRARRSPATSWTACRARPSASRTTSRPTASRPWPRRPCRACAPEVSLLTLTYLGAERARAQLQHHGPGQGLAGGQRALPRGQPRAEGHPRQRHLGRADQTLAASGIKDFGKLLDVVAKRRRCAAT